MSQNNEKMKRVVEEIVTNLAKKGIKVEDAAVLKIGDVPPQNNKIVDNVVANVLSKFAANGFPVPENRGYYPPQNGFTPDPTASPTGPSPRPKAEQEQPCNCPDCLNFDNFEQALGEGTYDYTTMSVGGKTFDVKYYNGANGEHLMMSPQTYKVNPEWTETELNNELNIAIRSKEYDKAQILLNALNNIKK